MAKVRVSFTMVAYSNTIPFVPCNVSQVEAAAVTEEVSFIAVPANRPKPKLERPSIDPNVGKMIASITLNKKTTEMACAISSSSASITGAVAAMEAKRKKLTDMLLDCKILKEAYDERYEEYTQKINHVRQE